VRDARTIADETFPEAIAELILVLGSEYSERPLRCSRFNADCLREEETRGGFLLGVGTWSIVSADKRAPCCPDAARMLPGCCGWFPGDRFVSRRSTRGIARAQDLWRRANSPDDSSATFSAAALNAERELRRC